MQHPLTRGRRARRAGGLALPWLLLAGCNLNPKPKTDGSRQVAQYAKRLKPAPAKAPTLPSSLAGVAASGEADLAAFPADSLPAGFIKACADYAAAYCVNRKYGDELLQVAIFPDPASALGAAGRLAYGVERKGKKGPETGLNDALAVSRRGHRLALVTGPLAGLKKSRAARLKSRLESLVRPGGPDAGLEFMQTWRRLGIDRSKIRYEQGFWGRADLRRFFTPIDAGELFYFDDPKPAETIAHALQTAQFDVAGGKRLIFATEKYGEVQLILGPDWVMGVQKIEDPARAGQLLDDALYAPAERAAPAPAAMADDTVPGYGR